MRRVASFTLSALIWTMLSASIAPASVPPLGVRVSKVASNDVIPPTAAARGSAAHSKQTSVVPAILEPVVQHPLLEEFAGEASQRAESAAKRAQHPGIFSSGARLIASAYHQAANLIRFRF